MEEKAETIEELEKREASEFRTELWKMILNFMLERGITHYTYLGDKDALQIKVENLIKKDKKE